MDGATIRKAILVTGIILLVIIWTRNLGLFSTGSKPYVDTTTEENVWHKPANPEKTKQDNTAFSTDKMQSGSSFIYQEDYKDPFKAPFLYEKKEEKGIPSQSIQLKKPELPPKLFLTGIIWDSRKPVATVRNEQGYAFVVTRGDSIGEVVIGEISREELYYTFENRQYKLSLYAEQK